jgi:hypothetical protein
MHSLIHYSFVVNSLSYSDRSAKFLCEFLITRKSATCFIHLKEKFTFISEHIIYVALANEHSVFLQPVCNVTANHEQFLYQEKEEKLFFLGTFVKLWKAAISFVIEWLRSHWTDFLEIWSVYFLKILEKIRV